MSGHDGAAPAPSLAYIEVKAEAVPSATRRAAAAAVALAASLMPYLPQPPSLRVRWFREAAGAADAGDVALAELGRLLHAVGEGDPRGGGFYSDTRLVGRAYSAEDHTLWVAAHLSPREAAITTLHEARHLAQFLLWPPRHYGPLTAARRARYEADAESFAQEQVGAVRW